MIYTGLCVVYVVYPLSYVVRYGMVCGTIRNRFTKGGFTASNYRWRHRSLPVEVNQLRKSERSPAWYELFKKHDEFLGTT